VVYIVIIILFASEVTVSPVGHRDNHVFYPDGTIKKYVDLKKKREVKSKDKDESEQG
jgi:hypothetical protein